MRRFLQALFGLTMGVAAHLVLPGNHAMGLILSIALSLTGALAGGLLSEYVLPADVQQTGGYAASALGAFAILLVYGIVVQQ